MPKLTDSLRSRLRMIEGLGRLYWGEHGYILKEEIKSKTEWRGALSLFLEHYAFERLGGFPVYSEAAIKAVRAVAGKSRKPYPSIVGDVWQEFKRILKTSVGTENKKVKLNEKVNPLYPRSRTWKKPLLQFITELTTHDFNIILWARDMLSRGKAESAYEKLECVRGISQKIGTFFLRDITYAFDISETKIGDPTYIQPADNWVRKAAVILLGETSNDWKLAEGLADIARKCGVSGCLMNTGLWILGSEIAESGEYESSLTSARKLADCFNAYAEETMHWGEEIRKLAHNNLPSSSIRSL